MVRPESFDNGLSMPSSELFLLLSKQLSFSVSLGCRIRPDSLRERPQHLCFISWAMWFGLSCDLFLTWPVPKAHPFWGSESRHVTTELKAFCFCFFHSTQIGHMDTIQRKPGFSKKDAFIFGKA